MVCIAAEQNNAASKQSGSRYANGQGVKKDLVEAVKWFRKAAEQNNAGAQDNLGSRYANGQGVEKDLLRLTSGRCWRCVKAIRKPRNT